MNRWWWRDSETPACRQLPPNQRIANWDPAKQRQILLLGDEAVGWISRTCAVGCRFLSSPQRKWRRLLPLVGGLEQGRPRNMLLRSSSIWKRAAKSICFELCVETWNILKQRFVRLAYLCLPHKHARATRAPELFSFSRDACRQKTRGSGDENYREEEPIRWGLQIH